MAELKKIIDTLKEQNKSLEMQVINNISPTKEQKPEIDPTIPHKLKVSERQVHKLE